jgi:crossover junction endodeoxyribonuclease RuvC
MFVVGIDPGLSRCGYGAVRRQGGTWSVVAGGVVTTDPSAPLHLRLATLRLELAELLAELRPPAVAVERVFFQTNARTAMATGQASGVALLVAAEAGCQVVQYTPNEVKLAVCGDGGADKGQVQRMVARIVGLPAVPGPPDVADALALAVCHATAAPLARAVAEAGGGRR